MSRSLPPEEVWELVKRGEARILDVRTAAERKHYGAPPGAEHVSLAHHAVSSEGPPAVYLCQHAVRSKLTLRNGAAEVEGGFVAWERAGLPVDRVS